VKIAKVLGTEELYAYVEKYNVQLDSHYDDILGNHPRKPWAKFITPQNDQLVTDEAIDLLSKMLKYDHAERVTPKDAMDHPYFKPVKDHHAPRSQMLLTTCASRGWSKARTRSVSFKEY
jgi:casein kinase II subunit alpha